MPSEIRSCYYSLAFGNLFPLTQSNRIGKIDLRNPDKRFLLTGETL